jgi:hypothetical protein
MPTGVFLHLTLFESRAVSVNLHVCGSSCSVPLMHISSLRLTQTAYPCHGMMYVYVLGLLHVRMQDRDVPMSARAVLATCIMVGE